MENFKKQIIEQVKETLLDEVDEQYHTELIKGYKQSLNRVFKGLTVKKEKYNEALNDEIALRKEELGKISPLNKLSLYIEDTAYCKLIVISNQGMELAENRLYTGIIQDKVVSRKAINSMKDLMKNVRDFNQINAQVALEDGILDYNYACGEDDIFSLRVSPLN